MDENSNHFGGFVKKKKQKNKQMKPYQIKWFVGKNWIGFHSKWISKIRIYAGYNINVIK